MKAVGASLVEQAASSDDDIGRRSNSLYSSPFFFSFTRIRMYALLQPADQLQSIIEVIVCCCTAEMNPIFDARSDSMHACAS